MGYKLEKPFTDIQRADFVCEHQGLNYYEDDNCIIMYSNSEKIENGESIDISQTPEYIAEQKKQERLRIQNIFITKLQFFKVLKALYGITFEDVMPLVNSDPNAKMEFELSSGFLRGNPLFNAFAPLLNLTPEDMDAVFEKGLEY